MENLYVFKGYGANENLLLCNAINWQDRGLFQGHPVYVLVLRSENNWTYVQKHKTWF